MGSSPTRGSSFFLGKVTALGVLCCFALFICLLLSFFLLISHLKHVHVLCRLHFTLSVLLTWAGGRDHEGCPILQLTQPKSLKEGMFREITQDGIVDMLIYFTTVPRFETGPSRIDLFLPIQISITG